MVTPSPVGLARRIVRSMYRAVLRPALPGTVQGACHYGLLAATIAFLAVVTGCSPRYHDMPSYWPIPTREYDNYGPGRFKTAFLATQIDRYFRGASTGPIGVTTFVNIDDLYTTSTFGRMYAEQLMSELTMHGFDVIELRQSDALQFLDSSGEFALSRDVRAVRPERNLSAIVVGTYVSSPERVYVNARLVDPASSRVLSAGSVEMSKTAELTKLLRGGTIPASLERIPVRHLGLNTYPTNPFDPARRRQWELEESEFGVQAPRQGPARLSIPTPPRGAPEEKLQEAPGEGKPRIEIGGRILGDVLSNEPTSPGAQ